MPIELGGITLQHLTHIAVHERARIVQHPVPGMSGDLAQVMGRSSVGVSFRGVFYGPGAGEGINRLRSAHLENKPVDFFTEAVGEGYFAQVLIARLEVSQRARYLDQFDFFCDVVEYLEPPVPVTADPLAALDAGLRGEAAGLVDGAQAALEQASQLANLLDLVPDLGNPTTPLSGILVDFQGVAGAAGTSLSAIGDLF